MDDKGFDREALEEVLRMSQREQVMFTDFDWFRTVTRTTDNTAPLRRMQTVQGVDGRVYEIGVDYASSPKPETPKLPTVQSVLSDPVFQAACRKGGVTPTTRQASKYRRQMGTAWRSRLLPEPLPEGRARRARDDEEV